MFQTVSAFKSRTLTATKSMLLQAKANRGILYVDEVNLLDDGLVDVVLDSAASGVNTVEREGISISHPAKFIMIGSGNPTVGTVLSLSELHGVDLGQYAAIQHTRVLVLG